MPTQNIPSGIKNLFGQTLFTISKTDVTLVTIIIFVVLVVVTAGASWLVQRAVERGLRMRGVGDVGTIGITKRLTHYVVMLIGLAIAFNTIGIQLGALFAAGAVFAVAIGFAMQNIAQNFVSGIILLVERTIKPGDVLVVENRVVRVEKMGLRSTIARSRDEEELIIPNGTLVQSTVTNYTLRDSLFRLRAQVGVAYDSDLRLVRATLEEAASAVAWRIHARKPRVLLLEFGSSSVNYDISVWIDNAWEAPLRRSELNEAVWWALKEAQVVIAFPQVDVHFDAPVEAALTRVS